MKPWVLSSDGVMEDTQVTMGLRSNSLNDLDDLGIPLILGNLHMCARIFSWDWWSPTKWLLSSNLHSIHPFPMLRHHASCVPVSRNNWFHRLVGSHPDTRHEETTIRASHSHDLVGGWNYDIVDSVPSPKRIHHLGTEYATIPPKNNGTNMGWLLIHIWRFPIKIY